MFSLSGMNSGVMYINVANASKHADSLIEFATARKFGFSTWDQGALEKHFGGASARHEAGAARW